MNLSSKKWAKGRKNGLWDWDLQFLNQKGWKLKTWCIQPDKQRSKGRKVEKMISDTHNPREQKVKISKIWRTTHHTPRKKGRKVEKMSFGTPNSHFKKVESSKKLSIEPHITRSKGQRVEKIISDTHNPRDQKVERPQKWRMIHSTDR